MNFAIWVTFECIWIGDTDDAVEARTRIGWNKFRQLVLKVRL